MISQIGSKTSSELSDQLSAVFKNIKDEISGFAEQAPENIVESVHLIRKRFKLLRAFVKLTQFCSEGDQYKQINILFRDCGRLISDCRDVHVRGLLLDEFRQTKTDRPYFSYLKKLIELNNNQTTEIENQLLSGTSVFDELIADLNSEPVLNYFFSLKPDAESLITGYARCYQKSYRAFHSELTNHEADLLHEWRKRTKDLQYQLELMTESVPVDLPPSLEEVSELCEVLGRINDLFMLSDWIKTHRSSKNRSALLEEIHHELESLEADADNRGHSLYRLAPEEYSRQLQQAVLQ
ncbi:CHAD domain-containing protein [Rhodohalobacter sp. 614A]|uniref:CHAD domain-containing protein n=1 Tax=Rhodohalobacter sp. 614A TaxID=2908649 RepID=UPI001F3743B4|nr:CHAD domain-containing protein [Rhodohalobacter sp. 614A]